MSRTRRIRRKTTPTSHSPPMVRYRSTTFQLSIRRVSEEKFTPIL